MTSKRFGKSGWRRFASTPDAFGSAHAVEAKETLADFASKIAHGGLFGGLVDQRLEGIAGFGVSSAAQA
jgi:hypothetical protein